jgi:hypothetical protein
VTYLTKPVNENHLLEFYKKTHPGGIGWKRIANKLPEVQEDSGFLRLSLDWFMGILMVYSVLYGLGRVLFADYFIGILALTIGLACGLGIYLDLQKRGFETVAE